MKRRKPDSLEVLQMKAQAKEEKARLACACTGISLYILEYEVKLFHF